MDRADWAFMVERLQEAYPHQQISDETAKLWYKALEQFTREEIARALVRCLREREFLSSYALAEAVRDERRERSATRSTALPLPAKGVPMPPETKEAIGILKQSLLLPDHPDHLSGEQAHKRIDQLADYLDARLAEGTTAPRRNPGQPDPSIHRP